MKQRSCPNGKDFCFDYGSCEDCEWGKIIEQNKKLKKKNKKLLERLSKTEARLKEIFTDIDNAFSLYYPHGQIPYDVLQDVIKQLAKKKGVEVE